MNFLSSLSGMSNMCGMGGMQNMSGMGGLQNLLGMGGGVSLNLNIGLNLGNMDCASISSAVGDSYGMGCQNNPMANLFGNGMSSMGCGMTPGFGGSCNQAGSLFGGLMQQYQQQQQMMQMMMMMLMMMMMQRQNGFGGGMGGMGCGNGMNGISGGGYGGGYGSPINMGTGNYGNYGSAGTTGATSGSGATPGGGGGAAAVGWAQKYLGRDSYSLKGDMPYFQAAGGRNNNCADFVSSCLQNAGMLDKHEINVKQMEKTLQQKGWVQVPREQARPGDVWMNNSRGHVELVEKNVNGKISLIGSNNGGDSIQEITRDNYSGNNGGVFYRHP